MTELNKEQYRASRADTGVSLVLAGAGTGKTKTLVEKVVNVMGELGIDPSGVLLLTFSRKAAEELRERVALRCGRGREITAGTFHSFCFDLLRRNSEAFMEAGGFSRFPSVVDDEGGKAILMELIRRDMDRFMGVPAGVIHDLMMRRGRLDGWKKRKIEGSGLGVQLANLGEEYRETKRRRGLIDYDDMMMRAIELLERNGAVRAGVLARYRYIFVDEFQDVSDENIRLLKLLLPDRERNLFAVISALDSPNFFTSASFTNP